MHDLTMKTNHWVMQDPSWKDYSKSICTDEHCWYLYYGDDYFLKTSKTERFPVEYPNIATHFYVLDWKIGFKNDTIFASYLLSEIKRFIDTLDWPEDSKLYGLRVRDLVTKTEISIQDIINGDKNERTKDC